MMTVLTKMRAKVPFILTILGVVSVVIQSGIVTLRVSAQETPQTEDNKALVTEFFTDVYDNRNVSAVDHYLDDNFTSHVAGGIDKEMFKLNLVDVLKTLPDLARSLDNVIAEGDMVAMFNSWNGTANGDSYTAVSASLFRISDGQIVELWHVADYSNLTKALGM